MLKTHNYNPDVLTCLANLSNDEVFTPPQMANAILDMLPDKLWSNPDIKFLDPVCKSGVFLREIAKRLDAGLESKIPDKQERLNHIFKEQLFGIAITELTGLLARRSAYCSKKANSEYSVCEFDDEQGNIIFNVNRHKFSGSRCVFCGASKETYDRDSLLEQHAYQFIHTSKPEEIFDMKFDVIIGNPPYQLSDGGGTGTSAISLYQKFVEQAKSLNPRYLSMIIPSRWFSGGKGLDDFREEMLNDDRLTNIVDFFDSTECFPGVDISGGVCYFLWERDNKGECKITTVRNGERSEMTRPLLEKNNATFIRFNEAVNIVRKISKLKEKSFESIVSARKPYGFGSQVTIKQIEFDDSVYMYAYPKNGYIAKNYVIKNSDWINKYKVFIAKAYGERGSFPYLVIGKPFIGKKGTCCSETYLTIGPCSGKKESENIISYMRSRLFRFLVLLKKNTQNAARGVYSLVPMQDFNKEWSDEALYKKYGITKTEIAFIESMVRPMEAPNE